ncbi:mechanosensitive ion channel family protein [Candidatus Desantisbacteria bacterium]|nr:mechanosensitive ion channel family protein [Candidatus Desantisbacteria bacterium]
MHFEILNPILVFLLTLILGVIIRKLLFKRLSNWAKNTETKIDDIIIESTKGPFIILCLILGLFFSLKTIKISDDMFNVFNKILIVLTVILITIVLSNIVSKFIKYYSGKVKTAVPITSFTQNISRIIIIITGVLVILHNLGISIAPILATLGVGSLAVALALQDTLANFFAGFYIIMARQIKIGDYIKLESGEEGHITDINWRITKIKMLPNNVILVPNEKITKSIITNYYLPDKEMAISVTLGVHYKSDLKKVERITCETAKEVMKNVPGGVPGFEPFVRYSDFGDSSIHFTVVLRAKEFVDQYLIKHEFIKRLHEHYLKDGIIIPFPIRAINYSQEKET